MTWTASQARFVGNRAWAAQALATVHLGALVLMAMTAWRAVGNGADASIAGNAPGLHLALVMGTGAAAALLTIANRDLETAAGTDIRQAASLSDLMAQMSHELRTPLNAVIGFAEIMARELHGPLGHARYQEYVHHISESGGRLLKSSEDALAVTRAVTALMQDRRHRRRERHLAGPLVRSAWAAATATPKAPLPRLAATTCNSCDLVCESEMTAQALEHLFGEAIEQAGGRPVEVIGRRQGGARSLEIGITKAGNGSGRASADSRLSHDPPAPFTTAPGSLRVILARLLLEAQGATFACGGAGTASWSAVIEFPPR